MVGKAKYVVYARHGGEQVDEDVSWLWYCGYLLGRIDHKRWWIEPARSRPLISAAAEISEHKP